MRIEICGAKRKDLFRRGDLVFWEHWVNILDAQGWTKDKELVVERGVVLKVYKEHRSNRLPDGTQLLGRTPLDIWKALVYFNNGDTKDLPLVCLRRGDK